jgi:hypothetical protein
MSLKSADLREVRDLIARVFTPADLEMLVRDYLEEPLAHLVGPGTHPHQVFVLLQACDARGWLERLLDGVAEQRWQNPDVARLMQRMGRPTSMAAAGGAGGGGDRGGDAGAGSSGDAGDRSSGGRIAHPEAAEGLAPGNEALAQPRPAALEYVEPVEDQATSRRADTNAGVEAGSKQSKHARTRKPKRGDPKLQLRRQSRERDRDAANIHRDRSPRTEDLSTLLSRFRETGALDFKPEQVISMSQVFVELINRAPGPSKLWIAAQDLWLMTPVLLLSPLDRDRLLSIEMVRISAQIGKRYRAVKLINKDLFSRFDSNVRVLRKHLKMPITVREWPDEPRFHGSLFRRILWHGEWTLSERYLNAITNQSIVNGDHPHHMSKVSEFANHLDETVKLDETDTH